MQLRTAIDPETGYTITYEDFPVMKVMRMTVDEQARYIWLEAIKQIEHSGQPVDLETITMSQAYTITQALLQGYAHPN